MHKAALADLTKSGIDQAAAEYAGLFGVPNARKLFKTFGAQPALVIPYYDIDGEPVLFGPESDEFGRVRYLGDLPVDPYTGKKGQRYDQPAKSGCHAYFPKVSHFDWARLANDPEEHLIITEGEKKALCACIMGMSAIGLGGVFNFMRDGEFLPELDAFTWQGRTVFIIFDSDARTNVEIQRAEARLVEQLRKRGAILYVVRLPAEGDTKVGLDDYLVRHGMKRLTTLVSETLPLDDMDAAVVAMNNHVCWISRDKALFDFGTREFIDKADFVTGEIYGTAKATATVTTGKAPGQKLTHVAPEWLKHPHALRYADLLFRPGAGPIIENDQGMQSLNVWEGWRAASGDVQPFLDLSEHLFANLPESERHFALQLMAYKAQNPSEKVPIALVLIGLQGCGKSLWAECLAEAFAPYHAPLNSSALISDFQGWLERTLLATLDEVKPEDLRKGADNLKGYITNLSCKMNEKYRVSRKINSYTMYILTSNHREVGSYSSDDRRMFVVDCPPKRDKPFYDRIRDWKRANGGQHLMHWLLNVDLEGWRPPQAAPETAEKSLATQENMDDVARIAQDMLTGDEHIMTAYIHAALAEAEVLTGSQNPTTAQNARTTLDVLPSIQIRPFYTADELAQIFPALAAQLSLNRRTQVKPAGIISRLLRENGITYLRSSDSHKGFMHKGKVRQYLIVADQVSWQLPITQQYFDNLMSSYPRFKQLPKKTPLLRGDK